MKHNEPAYIENERIHQHMFRFVNYYQLLMHVNDERWCPVSVKEHPFKFSRVLQ
jgi:hypothetical protein